MIGSDLNMLNYPRKQIIEDTKFVNYHRWELFLGYEMIEGI